METQKDQARPSNLYDQLIDQYKLEAHITQTAVTDLYRAFDVDENRAVAIEILLPVFNNKRQYVELFLDKMNKVAQLKHPNIAQVYQIGLTPTDRPYVARDLVEGITLRERLRQLAQQGTPANSIYALKIVRQLAEALELAERLDLYHHHLTPDNIMLKHDGTVVLVDLGVPAAENGTAAQLPLQLNMAYVAPELANGKPVDSRSQIFALGVILHEILTGELPTEAGSFWQTFALTLKPQNTALEEARPDLSRQTYDLIDKSLRKQPWGRYNTIQEFLEAINEALQSERLLIQTRGETSVISPPPPRRSRLMLLLPVAILILSLSAVAAWAFARNQSNGGQPTEPAITLSETAEESATPTPQLPQTSPDIELSQEAIPISEVTSVDETIEILGPPNASEFQAGDTVNFNWSSNAVLQENQRFAVYLLTENGRSLLGSISAPSTDGTYSLQTLLPDSSTAAEWHVVLEDLTTNRDIVTSNNSVISIKPAPATPTFTSTPTNTPTPTFTVSPTPIPQVEVFVSSASLRQGPGTVYPILRYLYQGDVVAVLAKDNSEGEWYNVILDDGLRGWLAASASRLLDENSINIIPIAATIPPRPTNTPTPTPTNTPTPTATFTPAPGGGGGSNPQPTSPPASPTPPPLPGG
ncbi:MAG: protein kinase [Anaerolineales bacterium]|nr:protein kinase [Anaerolineales bacterium]